MNRAAAFVAAAVVGLGACKTLDAPDQNAPTLQDLTGAPTRASIAAASQGLLAGLRATGPCTGNCAYIGREGMNLDPSNPQNVPTTYLTGGDFAAWANAYQNDKLANIVIAGLDKVTIGMTDAEKTAVKGFAKTVKAIDLMYVIQTTDQTGAVLDVPESPTDPIPPVATRAAVYTRIIQLLDDGYADLGNGGASFPFTFPAGYTGFTTPTSFRFFNRAIKARIDNYNSNYAGVLADLAQAMGGSSPFKTTPASLADLNVGVYHTYSTNAGDATNGVYDATDRQRFAHNSLAAQAKLQATASGPTDTAKRDDRFLRKVRPVKPQALNRYFFDVFWAFQVYNSTSDPIPVIREEELVLLRAEANLACTGAGPSVSCGNTDRTAALADINLVRTISGKLAAATDLGPGGTQTGDQLLDELLYNKRYSLLWEGGYSWFDARHYGVLDKLNHGESLGQTKVVKVNGVDTVVPVENGQAGQVVFQFARLPDNECNARSITINATPAGAGGPCQLAAGK
jgi:hypothetical protein